MTGLPETSKDKNWWFWRYWTSINKEQWSLRHNKWDKLYDYPILLPWESFQPPCREKKHRQISAESLSWEDRLESREIKAAAIHRTQSRRRESHRKKERQRPMEGPRQVFSRVLRHMYVKELHEPEDKPPERIGGNSHRRSHWVRNNVCSPARVNYVIIHRALGKALKGSCFSIGG